MDNYSCNYIINDLDITIHFKCNDQIVFSFLTEFEEFYTRFVSIYDRSLPHQRFEFLNSNGVIQITKLNEFLSFEFSRYTHDVYADSVFRVRLNNQFDRMISNIKMKKTK